MPIYEYKCLDCNERFSLIQKMSTKEKDTICTKCGSNNVKKEISTFSCTQAASGEFSMPASLPAGAT